MNEAAVTIEADQTDLPRDSEPVRTAFQTLAAPRPAIVVRTESSGLALDWWRPANMTEAMAMADMIARSTLVPKDYVGKPGNILVAMAMGAEVGLGPLASLQNIAVINGRPALWGDAMLAVCMVHPLWGGISETYEGEKENLKALCRISRKGEEDAVGSFSIAQAKLAGLWGKAGPWTLYPARMLKLRARAFGLRDKFPDALRGLKSAEELQDMPSQEAPAPLPVGMGAALDLKSQLRAQADAAAGRAVVTIAAEADEPPPPHDPVTGEVAEGALFAAPPPAEGPVSDPAMGGGRSKR